ncbi:S9 family peptidase [Dokdonella koreensis]|uniref:Prolyl oligopeptidase family protein n=1 Tax=Dokdonella koreensis DS-123 TaxID=1300342 RepID=A0A160DXS5_9GAMM|nr:S9 family peptidase [Dokdonella koreensis]ANB19121.1 Prolyl oligopeptidase family protein [Dokdonella koreensis DS-123]
MRLPVLLSVLFLAVPAASFAEEAPPPIPIGDFVKRPEVEQLQLSPTGKYLAMTVPLEDGRTGLYIVDRETIKPSASILASGNNVIDRFWWANNDRVVATLAQKFGGVDKPQPTGELFAIDADGKNSKQIFGYRSIGEETGSRIRKGGDQRYASAEPLSRIPDKDKRILIGVYEWKQGGEPAVPMIELLDIYTGKSSIVGKGPAPGAELILDHTNEARVAKARGKDNNLVFYVRAGRGSDWTVFNDSKESDVVMDPLMFTRDNRSVYVQVSEDAGPDGLYRIDLETRQKTLVYRGAADPGALLITADGQDAYAVLTQEGKTGVHVFDTASPEGRMTRALAASFPGQTAFFTNFTRDGRYGLVNVSSDRNPGDFYFFDLEQKKADYLVSRRRWIEPDQLAEMRPIELKASDGVALHGYLTLPKGTSGKNLPLVVNPHGGPHGVRDVWGYSPEVQLLASRGYAVLQVNFRGSGGYGYDFGTSGYRQWGMRMQDDVTDATRWAISEGYADPKRICIYGASYGGYAALMGAIREPDLYRCTIGYVGVYNLAMMHERGDIPNSLYGRNYLRMAVGDNREDMLKRSPASNVDKLKAAVMLVHGGKDERVPIAQAQTLRKALDGRGYKYEWLVKDGEGHGFYLAENQTEFYTKLLAFLDSNIGPRAATAPAAAP